MSAVSNGAIIAYFLLLDDQLGIYGLAGAYLLGWLLQAAIQLPSLKRTGFVFHPSLSLRSEGMKKVFALMGPVMVSTWVQPINLVINSRFGSRLYGGGGVSVLEYSTNLYLVIAGTFILSVTNVIFPRLSRMAAGERQGELEDALRTSLHGTLFFVLPMAAGLMLLSRPLISFLYGGGQFDGQSVALTSSALTWLSLGMVGYAVQNILSRAYFARQKGMAPLVAGACSIGANLLLCALLVEPLGIVGLALPSAVSSTVYALLLMIPMQRERVVNGALVRDLGKMLLCTLLMAAAVWAVRGGLGLHLPAGKAGELLLMAACALAGCAVYFTAAALVDLPEGRLLRQLAEQAGQLKLTDKQRNDMIALLTDSRDLNADGLFTYALGTKTYIDVDTTATALNALVKYNTDKYPEVQGFITKAVAGLSKAQGSDGSYGNVNSDAMVILGLLSVGIDPAKDARFVKGGCSLADALLLYVNSSSNGFVVAGAGTGEQGDKARALATEQGFRALVALEKYAVLSGENKGTVRYNIYTLTGEIVKENGTTETKPEQPSPDKGFDSDKPGTPDDSSTGGNTGGSTGGETKSISVHVTVRTNDAQWVSGDYTITKGQSALDALQKALKANGITCQTKDSQYGTYVRSLTRNGETLGELDQGPNSGWMYQINGKTPMVGIDAYGMEGGDKLLFYYVADYTKEDAGGSLSGGGQTKELPFTDVVDTSWFYAAVQYVWEKGLMTGMDGKTFSPESTTTRAQLVTILWQLAGCPDSESGAAYSDTQASAWYAKAVAWAGANGIVSGYADGSFGPDDAVTREQFAAILYRYAQSLGEGFTGSWYFLLDYSDAQQISAWADEAMHWCVMKGILSGTGADTLSPGMSTTRGQMAVMLMQFCQRNEK